MTAAIESLIVSPSNGFLPVSISYKTTPKLQTSVRANLAFAPMLSMPVRVRSTYRDGLPQTVHYESGRDYLLEGNGQIRRIPDSRIPDFRIPDFRTNVLYGREDFDHSQFPGFGNGGFFVFVDYLHRVPKSSNW